MGALTSPPPRPKEQPLDVKFILAKAQDELDATLALALEWSEICTLHRLTRDQAIDIARRLVALLEDAASRLATTIDEVRK